VRPNDSPLQIESNGNPLPFTITTSGEPWLIVNVDPGVTPATIHIGANATGLAPGDYTAQIYVRGPNNTLTIPVHLTVISTQPSKPQLQVTPTSLHFVRETSIPGSIIDQLITALGPPVTFTTRTLSGVDWLNILSVGNSALSVNASAVNIAPGDYTAEVVVSATGYPSVTVPITLTVLPTPKANTLRVSPAALSNTSRSR
jgi:hypothetical protein